MSPLVSIFLRLLIFLLVGSSFATVPASASSHADDQIVTFEWDKAGNKTKVTDGLAQVTSFQYDGRNRLTATIWDSDDSTRSRTDSTEYDALVATATVNQRPIRIEHAYNARLLLTGSTCTQLPGDNETRTYDNAGRLLTVKRTGASDLRNVTYAYDASDRMTSETSAGSSHSYGYDPAGNRTLVQYATGRKLATAYDSQNRVATIIESVTGNAATRETGYQYDLAGNVLIRSQANGTREYSGYNAAGRRVSQSTVRGTTPVSDFAYFHAPGGNLLRIDETYGPTSIPDRNVINTYDRQNRLLTEKAETLDSSHAVTKSVLTTYAYNKGDNRTSKNVTETQGATVVSNKTETSVYGSAGNGTNSNQLHSLAKDGQTSTYTYDVSGNRRTRSVGGVLKETYGWDSKNRLVSLVQSSPSKTFSYGYDYRARRVIRDESVAGGENTVVSFSGGTSAFEKVGTTVKVEYVRGSDYGGGIGGIMYTVRSGVNSFNAYNSRGDVVAKTTDAGTVTWQATYESFGTRTTETGTNPDRQKANTKEEDPTGLLNEGFRYRDLVTGSFISRDPLGFVDGPNVYTYVNQNPWSSFDPLGLEGFGIRQDRQIQRQLGVSNSVWDAAREKASRIISGPLQVIAGFIPWVGDALDVKDVVSPSSTPTDRVIGGTSLATNLWTAGIAPNAGPIVRGGREAGEAIDDVIDLFRGADDALHDAMDVSQREIVESQADAIRDMAGEGLIPNATARGQTNEINKLDQLGEAKNTEVFSTSEGNTIPDINNPKQLGDIKDTKILSNDAQMRAQREAAQRAGKEHVVHTGTNTKVTKPMTESSSRIERHDDLGPQNNEP